MVHFLANGSLEMSPTCVPPPFRCGPVTVTYLLLAETIVSVMARLTPPIASRSVLTNAFQAVVRLCAMQFATTEEHIRRLGELRHSKADGMEYVRMFFTHRITVEASALIFVTAIRGRGETLERSLVSWEHLDIK